MKQNYLQTIIDLITPRSLRIRTRNKREFQEAHEIETSNSHNEKRKGVRNMKQEVGAPVGGKKVIHMKSDLVHKKFQHK